MRKNYEVPEFNVYRWEKKNADIICTSGLFSSRTPQAEIDEYMDGMGVKTGKAKYGA